MKRLIILSVLSLFVGFGSLKAMSYEAARDQAWFLTDKMAYELNLTPAQYDLVYQINLDYLMSIDRASDCYGYYWTYRDADLSYVLFDWQYSLYATLDYFYRPIRWLHSAWYYPVFDRYRRGYYYFTRPTVYINYRGGMWARRGHNDVSPYRGVRFTQTRGMRDAMGRGGASDFRPEYGRSTVGNRRGSMDRPSNRNIERNNNTAQGRGNGNSSASTSSQNSRPSQSLGTQSRTTTRSSSSQGRGSYSQPGLGNSSSRNRGSATTTSTRSTVSRSSASGSHNSAASSSSRSGRTFSRGK